MNNPRLRDYRTSLRRYYKSKISKEIKASEIMFPGFFIYEIVYKALEFFINDVLTFFRWRCNIQIGNILHKWREKQ